MERSLGEACDDLPAVIAEELSRLRSEAETTAKALPNDGLDPDEWPNGRMEFEFERRLAHEHERLRDRLAEVVSAQAGVLMSEISALAGRVAIERGKLQAADQKLVTVLHSWNALHREVQGNQGEMRRYLRLRSSEYKAVKYVIAGALFLAEVVVSTALFARVVSQDNQAFPLIFALGLILVLMVVPHYAAIALKDGFLRYHEVELREFDDAGRPAPESMKKSARREALDNAGLKLAGGVVGLVLVGLIVPVSSLRASELGGKHHPAFWFAFFLLLQATVSGYFFLREWIDYGTPSSSLLQCDSLRENAEQERADRSTDYAQAVTDYQDCAQSLSSLYRQVPRWDSNIVQSYLGTIHHYRHLMSVDQPRVAFFIARAVIPVLPTREGAGGHGPNCGVSPVVGEHPDLVGTNVFSRYWWMDQVAVALKHSTVWPDSRLGSCDGHQVSDLDALWVEVGDQPASAFDSPVKMLEHMLGHYFGLSAPYRRPAILDEVHELQGWHRGNATLIQRLPKRTASPNGTNGASPSN